MAVSNKRDYWIYLYWVFSRSRNHSDLVGICNQIQELLLFTVITQQKEEYKMKHSSNKKTHNSLSHAVDKERNYHSEEQG